MAARVHNVFSLAEILKIFLSETTKSIELWLCRPSNEHFCQVWFKSVLWFQKKRWKCEIPIGSNVKLSRVMAAILNFWSYCFHVCNKKCDKFHNFHKNILRARLFLFLAHLAIGHVSFCHV
jgi:hypothetical protein